ncbi:restriction endonuclease subunit S [Vibrio crassostreae]|uniref:restriction endonuclease subunit S n=1 Tax=Vibrio crassostreae TaxID=246167 RepID=UPI001B309FB2|nr:restriction endonuclease subunit S [Vibrio crassostreae]
MSVEQTSMNQLITDNIDIWTSTVKTKSASGRGSSKKRELYGVKKLRELILELAVRGKLVPQDPTDEPASVLLERIEKEKAQLVKDKKIKKPKKLPEVTKEQCEGHYPETWSAVRLGNVVALENGDRSKNYPNKSVLVDSGIPFVNAGHLVNGRVDKSEMTFITEERFEILRAGKFKNGDILFCLRGSLGKSALVDGFDSGAIASSLVIVRADESIVAKYLMLYFDSPISFENIKLYDNGTAQPNLSAADLAKFVVPVPSLKEQHRIVAKVDELMTLCDQLEQQTEASIEAHQVLVTTLLDTLTNSADAEELMQNWARISEHFDTLFTTEASIDQLKQTILQLAVMGKLVPQDPNDEPATKLLERIAEEKAQLIKDKKIKNQKALPPIADDEKLFGLANGWCFVRLDDICTGITSGSTPPKDKFIESEGVPYLKVYNIRNQKIDFSYKEQFVDSAHHITKLTRSILYPGDVVMNIVGPPLGKIAIIPDSYPEWNCNQAIVVFRPIESLLNKYIYTYLTAGLFLQSIDLIGTAGQDNISVTKSRSIVLPMPPLEEQRRIFARVEELMVVCDELKARLKESQTTQLHLTDAFVDLAL